MWISFSVSPSSSRDDGDARPAATTSATSSSSTSSLTIGSVATRRAPSSSLLERGQLAVADLGDALEVAGALGALGLHAQLVDLLLDLADALERLLLASTSARRARRGAPCASASSRSTGSRTSVGLLRHRGELDLELAHAPLGLVELERRGVDLHAQPRRRLVDEVDRLVGQVPVGDVAVGEHRRRDQRRVADAHAVVRLVALLQAAQDRDRVLDRRLADEHRLEAPLERGVLLDVLAVLVERRRADARSSPRASIGLSMFAASTAPSAAPAPTIVCSSSMKRTISPSALGDLRAARP